MDVFCILQELGGYCNSKNIEWENIEWDIVKSRLATLTISSA